MEYSFAHRAQDVPGAVEICGVSTDHDRQGTVFGAGWTARHRRVQYGNTACLGTRGYVANRTWTDRTHVDQQQVSLRRSRDSVGPQHNFLYLPVRRHNRDDNVGQFRNLSATRAGSRTRRAELINDIAAPSEKRQLVASGYQVPSHRSPHSSQTDESNVGHTLFLSHL